MYPWSGWLETSIFLNKVTEWMNLRALFITGRKIKKGTSMKHKYCIFILTAISLLLLTGCGESSKKENVWDPPIEGLTWGMSSEEVKKYILLSMRLQKKMVLFG